MVHCSVIGCTSNSGRNRNKPVSFHLFPKNPDFIKLWEKKIGRASLPLRPVICSRHFTVEDFDGGALKKPIMESLGIKHTPLLKPTAVPTLHLGETITDSKKKRRIVSVQDTEKEQEERHAGSSHEASERIQSSSLKEENNTVTCKGSLNPCPKIPKTSQEESFDVRRYNKHCHEPFPVSCKICGKVLHSQNSLTVHMRRMHKDEKLYPCRICGKAFIEPLILEYHVKSHKVTKKLSCHLCGKKFMQRALLTAHLRMHSGKPFSSQQPFSTHNGENIPTDSKHDLVKVNKLNIDEKQHKDICCDAITKQVDEALPHSKRHSASSVHPYKLTDCGKPNETFFHIKIQTVSSSYPYKWTACGKNIQVEHDPTEHEKEVNIDMRTMEMLYTCKFCDMTFHNAGQYSLHMDSHEPEPLCVLNIEPNENFMKELKLSIKRDHTYCKVKISKPKSKQKMLKTISKKFYNNMINLSFYV